MENLSSFAAPISEDHPAHPANTNQIISTNGRKVERVFDPIIPLMETTKRRLVLDCHRSSREQCGFLTNREEIFYIQNIHEQNRFNFLMDPAEMLETITEIYEVKQDYIIGVFHTHPNDKPWPSPRDIVGWPNLDLHWRYWIVTNHEVIEWAVIK